jgi:hypothetical protein
MRRLSLRIAVILATFSALLLAVRLVASGSPSLAVNMLQAQQCDPKPCWQGVRPGVMTQPQAANVLKAQGALPDKFTPGDSHYCWSSMTIPFWRSCARLQGSRPDSIIEWINVEFLANPPSLGDAVLMFGAPIKLSLCDITNSRRSDLPRRFQAGFVEFQNNIVALVYVPDTQSERRLDPNMAIFRMEYRPSEEQFPQRSPWRGFVFVLLSGPNTCYVT